MILQFLRLGFLLLVCIYEAAGFSASGVARNALQQRGDFRKNIKLSLSILNPDADSNDQQQQRDERTEINPSMIVMAHAPPIIGFLIWGDISQMTSYFFAEFNSFQNVDGNTFAADILRPTINGIVVPAASIVLGTLFATTVNVLWNRQLQIRSIINKEVGELRLLRRALFGCFGTAQHSKRRAAALSLLHDYTRSLIQETQTDCIPKLKDIQEKRGISVNEMDQLADMLHGIDGAAASRESSVTTAESLLVSLNSHRSERVATTLSDFPRIHWLLLIFLYSTINVSFFIDSNQDVLQYLNSLQLRVLFSLILGVGSGSVVLIKGLENPFEGPFSIRLAARQLDYFDELLESDIQEAMDESELVGRAALVNLVREQERPKYGTGNTVYFHLLTGPWAGPVKVVGEVLSWIFRKLSRRVAQLSNLVARRGNRSKLSNVTR